MRRSSASSSAHKIGARYSCARRTRTRPGTLCRSSLDAESAASSR
jgi:hypothetical protein